MGAEAGLPDGIEATRGAGGAAGGTAVTVSDGAFAGAIGVATAGGTRSAATGAAAITRGGAGSGTDGAFTGVLAGGLVIGRAPTAAGSIWGAAERAADPCRATSPQVPNATIATAQATALPTPAVRVRLRATGTVISPQSPLSISCIQGLRSGSFSRACM